MDRKKKLEQLKDKINNSPIFELNPNTDSTEYKLEENKLFGNVYEYLLLIKPCRDGEPSKYAQYSLEILQVIKRCVKNYDAEKGEFLKYFNYAWKREFYILSGDNSDADEYSVKISSYNIKRIRKLKQIYGESSDLSAVEIDDKICKTLNINHNKYVELITLSKSKAIYELKDDIDEDDEDDGNDVKSYVITWDEDADIEFTKYDSIMSIMDRVEDKFNIRQERQKTKVAKILTNSILYWCSGDAFIVSALKGRAFFDEEVYEFFETNKRPMMKKELAESLNVKPSDISRTKKDLENNL